LNRNPDFMYTLFVPARAHLAFPCFDQPDLKARFALELNVPAGWEAVSNGAETFHEESGERVRIRYSETQPIPTYLFAFAAGRFQVETAERNGRWYRMFHRETDAKKVARNRDAIFDLHASSLDWMEKYTAIPYRFGKFDFVAIPSFQFGWNIPARSSTTPARCCWMNPRRKTRSWAAPALSHMRLLTCGSATW
jgi:aminopeptidase N